MHPLHSHDCHCAGFLSCPLALVLRRSAEETNTHSLSSLGDCAASESPSLSEELVPLRQDPKSSESESSDESQARRRARRRGTLSSSSRTRAIFLHAMDSWRKPSLSRPSA